MKDLHSKLSLSMAVAAAALTATPTPPAIDLADYDAAEIILSIGVGGITFTGANKIEFILTHSDDDATYTPVATADVLGAGAITDGIIKALTSAHAAAAVYRFGYIGGKRYLKLTPTFAGTHATGTPIAAVAARGYGRANPQADQA